MDFTVQEVLDAGCQLMREGSNASMHQCLNGLLVFSAPISCDFGNSCQTFKLLSNIQPGPAPDGCH